MEGPMYSWPATVYGLQEPETHYVVTVVEDDNGTEVILINDEPAPEIELIPGLEYC